MTHRRATQQGGEHSFGVYPISNTHFRCCSCGREWLVVAAHGRPAGFVKSAAMWHSAACGKRSPAQRRQQNAKDEKRWNRKSPAFEITNDPKHPGLDDDRGLTRVERGDGALLRMVYPQDRQAERPTP